MTLDGRGERTDRRAYRQRIRPKPRSDYYFIVAALATAAGGVALDAPPLAVGGAALWCVLTGRFCFARLVPARKCLSNIAEIVVTSVLIPPLAVFWRAVGALRFGVVFF